MGNKKFAWWKLLGLAGVVGVAATGAAVARQERTRRSYSADEIRDRLHQRHAQIAGEPSEATPPPTPH